MNRLGIAVVVVALSFIVGSVAGASITRVPVAKGSEIEKELGYTITVSPNGPNSDLAGTVTVEVHAPRTPKLQNLSRFILRTYQEKELTGRLPLELQKGKSGEVLCHFQVTPGLVKGSILELICTTPNMPNGEIYEIDLSAHVAAAER